MKDQVKTNATAILFSTLTLLGAGVGHTAELRAFDAPALDRPSYRVDRVPQPRRAEIRNLVVHSCESEGYTCGSGYTCEFIMSRGSEDAFGHPVELGSNRTNLRFYRCEKTGRAGPPTCSGGLTPSAQFIDGIGRDLRQLGGVESYTCQTAL